MEKRIPFVQFQSVKSVAKAIDPYLRQYDRYIAAVNGLDEEFKEKEKQAMQKLHEKMLTEKASKLSKLEADIQETASQIAAIEAGIVSIVGFHVTELVKKVIEPNDKGVKETKYIPTDIVTYDNTTKEFVVQMSDTPTTEDKPGSDYDVDKENLNKESSEDDLPWTL